MILTDWVQVAIHLESGQSIKLIMDRKQAASSIEILNQSRCAGDLTMLMGQRARPIVNNVCLYINARQVAAIDVEDSPAFLYAVKPESLEAISDGSEVLAATGLED
jgi:hypothetical protein